MFSAWATLSTLDKFAAERVVHTLPALGYQQVRDERTLEQFMRQNRVVREVEKAECSVWAKRIYEHQAVAPLNKPTPFLSVTGASGVGTRSAPLSLSYAHSHVSRQDDLLSERRQLVWVGRASGRAPARLP